MEEDLFNHPRLSRFTGGRFCSSLRKDVVPKYAPEIIEAFVNTDPADRNYDVGSIFEKWALYYNPADYPTSQPFPETSPHLTPWYFGVGSTERYRLQDSWDWMLNAQNLRSPLDFENDDSPTFRNDFTASLLSVKTFSISGNIGGVSVDLEIPAGGIGGGFFTDGVGDVSISENEITTRGWFPTTISYSDRGTDPADDYSISFALSIWPAYWASSSSDPLKILWGSGQAPVGAGICPSGKRVVLPWIEGFVRSFRQDGDGVTTNNDGFWFTHEVKAYYDPEDETTKKMDYEAFSGVQILGMPIAAQSVNSERVGGRMTADLTVTAAEYWGPDQWGDPRPSI
jgi:hypothetical protein